MACFYCLGYGVLIVCSFISLRSYGLSAYEGRDHGILVSHLKDILGEPIPIEQVFTRLRECKNELL